MRKLITVILILAVAALCLGCGRGEAPASPESGGTLTAPDIDTISADDGDGVVVLKKEALRLPDDAAAVHLTAQAGGCVYLCCRDKDDGYFFCRVDDRLNVTRLDTRYDEPIENFAANDSGDLFLLNTDAEGKKRIECLFSDGEHKTITPNIIADEGVILSFAAVKKGFIVDNMRELLALDTDGKLIKSFGKYQSGAWLVRLSDDRVFAVYSGSAASGAGNSVTRPARIDSINGSFAVVGSTELAAACTGFFGGTGETLFTSIGRNVYEYDYSTGSLTLKFDAGTSYLFPEYYIGQERYFALERGKPVILSARRDREVRQLTLAGYDIDQRIDTVVQMFNAANSGYIITVDDYVRFDEYEDQDAGKLRFAADIISGNTPDIYVMSADTAQKYAARGLLEDLMPYFDGEAGTGVLFDKLTELTLSDGKMFLCIPAFSVKVISGPADEISAPFTIDKLFEMTERYSAQTVFGGRMTRTKFMENVLMSMHGELYSPESGTCSFTSKEFIKILEITKSLLDESEWVSGEYGNAAAGKQMLLTEWLGPYFVDYIAIHNTVFGGSACITGFPSTQGHGAAILPQFTFGMSSASGNKDGVWEFFKYLLCEDTQAGFFGRWCFPANAAVFDAFSEAYLKSYAETPTTLVSGDYKLKGAMSEGEAREAVRELIGGIDSLAVYDRTVFDIIMGSCGAFFSGDKSAEETAEVIQSRVSIYLAEQYG